MKQLKKLVDAAALGGIVRPLRKVQHVHDQGDQAHVDVRRHVVL